MTTQNKGVKIYKNKGVIGTLCGDCQQPPSLRAGVTLTDETYRAIGLFFRITPISEIYYGGFRVEGVFKG